MVIFMFNKDRLSVLEFSCLICFPILALFGGSGVYNIFEVSGIDAYISVIISYFIGFFILGLFIYVLNYKKDMDINLKIRYLFGKYLGTGINIIIYLLLFVVGIVLLYNVSNFAISQFLSDTPLLIFMILFGLVVIYNVNRGIKNIARVGFIFLVIVVLFNIITFLGTIPIFDMDNLKPVLEDGINKPIMGGFITISNVIPIFSLLVIPKNMIKDNKNTNKYLIVLYTLAFLFAFLTVILTLGSLGIYLSKLYQYPEYTFLKKISLFNFIDRVENIIYIKWIFNCCVSLSLVIYYISFGVKKTSNKIVPSICYIIMIIASLYIFKNNTIFYNFCLYFFPYINLGLLLIFVIIGINIFIRKRLFDEK